MKVSTLTLAVLTAVATGCAATKAPAPASPAKHPRPHPRGRPAVHGVDPADMDPRPACRDFYQYADGGWLKKNPIPADYPSWGAFNELDESNREILHQILEKLAAERPPPAGLRGAEARRLLRELHGRGGDRGAGHRAAEGGARPDRRDDDPADSGGDRAPAERGVSAASSVRLGAGPQELERGHRRRAPGRPGPARPRLLHEDGRGVEEDCATKYMAHVDEDAGARRRRDRDGRREGEERPGARDEARGGLDDARRAAQPGQDLPPHEPRPSSRSSRRGSPGRPTSGTWASRPRRGQRLAAEVLRGGQQGLRRDPLADWKTYLRWQLVHAAAPSLSKKFVDERLRLQREDPPGDGGEPPRWKRCVAATDQALGMALGKIYVRPLPARRPRSAPTRWSGTWSPRCARTSRPCPGWARRRGRPRSPSSRLRPEDRLPRQVARLLRAASIAAAPTWSTRSAPRLRVPPRPRQDRQARGPHRLGDDAARRSTRTTTRQRTRSCFPPESSSRRSSTRRPTTRSTTAASARSSATR